MTERNRKFWVGKIKGFSKQRYADAEWVLVHFLSLQQKQNNEIKLLNERLKSVPKNSICVINRWYDSCGDNEYVNHIFPFKHIPDMIFWDASKKILLKSNRISVEFDSI